MIFNFKLLSMFLSNSAFELKLRHCRNAFISILLLSKHDTFASTFSFSNVLQINA